MLPIFRYETGRRLRGTVVLTVVVAAFALLMIAFFPSVRESSAAIEEYARNLPPALTEMFGLQGLSTIGGFLAAELYKFVWVLLLGIYLAYRASSLVAADVETHRIDLLLATPVSRTRLLLERFASLVPLVVLVNVVTVPVVYAGTVWVGATVPLSRLLAVHLLSVPYLLTCAAIGLACSVATSSESLANRAAMGTVFGLFVLESLATTAGIGWVGYASPTRYFEPTAVMVLGLYDWAGAIVLLGATGCLLLGARAVFVRADVV